MHSSPLFDPAGDGQEPDSCLASRRPGRRARAAGPVPVPARRVPGHGPVHPVRARRRHAPRPAAGHHHRHRHRGRRDGPGRAVRRSADRRHRRSPPAGIRVAWYSMATVREFAARNAGEGCVAEFAADQLAAELHLTHQSAAGQMDYASTVADRLPATFAALHAGTIHPVHVRIIEDETSILSPEDAARADAVLAEIAGSLTFGKLRTAAHRLVLELDPESAQRRKEAARRDAHVRRFREDSGNAGLIARELPPDEVLASWQHVDQRALDLRAAGVPGTLQELRVRAYLDLLQERDSRSALDGVGSTAAAGPEGTSEPSPQDDGGEQQQQQQQQQQQRSGRTRLLPRQQPERQRPRPSARPGHRAPPGRAGEHHHPLVRVDRSGRDPGRGGRARPGPRRRRPRPGRRGRPRSADPLVPHRAAPGRNRGRSRMCHRPGIPSPGTGPDPPFGADAPDWIARLRIRMTPIARGGCGHDRAEPGYRPSRALQHLIRTRNARCTAPGCGAARHPMRLGPHSALAPGRADLRVRPGAAVPTPSSLQAGPGVAAGTARTGRPDLAHPSRPHLRHQTHSLPRVTPAQAYPRHQRLAHPAAPNEATGTKPLVCSEQCGEVDRDGDRFGDGHCPGMDSG